MDDEWVILTTIVLKQLYGVADDAVHKLYGDRIAANFKNHGVVVHTVVLPGEEVRAAR